MAPYQVGREAFREGKLIASCPYHYGTAINEWKAGWYYQQRTEELYGTPITVVFTVSPGPSIG